jgi:splicing factor 3B subunit 3
LHIQNRISILCCRIWKQVSFHKITHTRQLYPSLLFQIESLAEDEEGAEWSSSSMDDDSVPKFTPHQLTHLLPVDEMQSYNPILDSKVLNLTQEDSSQVYSLCGTGPNSSLKVLRNGLQISEIISYPLPGSPISVWCLKARREGFNLYLFLFI